MNKNSLKDFLELNIEPTNLNRKDISLDAEEEINKERIKKLFGIALENKFMLYFDGTAVDDPPDGMELTTIEQQFFYNNGNSFLVFRDDENFEVAFKIKYLREYNFNKVYEITRIANKKTKANPELSNYKLYCSD